VTARTWSSGNAKDARAQYENDETESVTEIRGDRYEAMLTTKSVQALKMRRADGEDKAKAEIAEGAWKTIANLQDQASILIVCNGRVGKGEYPGTWYIRMTLRKCKLRERPSVLMHDKSGQVCSARGGLTWGGGGVGDAESKSKTVVRTIRGVV